MDRPKLEIEAEKVVKDYGEEIQSALSYRGDLEGRWLDWLKLYRGEPDSPSKQYPWPDASNLVVNLAAIYTDSIVARIMQSVFQIEPHWLVEPLSAERTPVAKPLERYLDWCRRHMWDQYRAVKPGVLEMVKLGTMVLFTGWAESSFKRYDPKLSAPIETARKVGPRAQWVPLDDFLMPPGFTRVNESEDGPKAPWVAYRQWMSRPSIEQYLSSGFFQLEPGEIEKLWKHEDDESELRTFRRESENREKGDGALSEGRLGGLWALWQVWFQQDLDGDGYPEEYVATIHPPSGLLLRFRPNPYVNGMRPFVHCPFVEQEGEFYGQGAPEMVEQYQHEVTTIHNQRRDNAHLANTTMLAARLGSGINKKERAYPGKIWLCQNPKEDLVPLNLGTNYALTVQEEQLSVSMAERRVGISDVNLGRESSPLGRAAATTVMALLQEGSRRFDLNITELRRALSEQGIQIVELFQTHGLPEKNVPASPEAVLGTEDGMLVRTLLESEDDIRGLVGITLNVSTAAVNREVEKQSSLQLFQVVVGYFERIMQVAQLATNPMAPPELKMIAAKMAQGADKLMDRIFQSHQTYDLDSVLMGDMLAGIASQPAQPPAPGMPMPGQPMGPAAEPPPEQLQ